MDTQSQQKILIIDDDTDLTDILRGRLKEAGFMVIVAHDGLAGLDLALSEKPGLILLDVKMPKMNGLEMFERLRKDPWGQDAKVIFLTVVDEPDVLSRAIELGGYEYFVKTEWKIDEIIERIKKKLAIEKNN